MSHYGIRAIDRTCGSYSPGHQMHWIQAKKSWEDGQPTIDVSVVVHNDGRIDLEGDELQVTMWNHDPERLRDVVECRGCGRAVWKPRFHVLAVPGPSGCLLSLGILGRTNTVPCRCATATWRVSCGFPFAGNEGRSWRFGAWAEPPGPRCGGGRGIGALCPMDAPLPRRCISVRRPMTVWLGLPMWRVVRDGHNGSEVAQLTNDTHMRRRLPPSTSRPGTCAWTKPSACGRYWP